MMYPESSGLSRVWGRKIRKRGRSPFRIFLISLRKNLMNGMEVLSER